MSKRQRARKTAANQARGWELFSPMNKPLVKLPEVKFDDVAWVKELLVRPVSGKEVTV